MHLQTEREHRAISEPGIGFFWAVTAAMLVIGGLKRLSFPGSIDFPLGEGGLFVLFSEAILGASFRLPATVEFGGQVLPFGYPPLGFYLAAAATKLTGADLFTIYHVLPRALNLLAIPAFCLFVARLSRDKVVFAVAALFFALMPDSIVWQITGGGMPRALAALFALLALAAAVPISEGRAGWRSWVLTGLLVGLTILSHLEWGILAAIGVSLLLATRLPLRQSVARLPLIGVVALVVILPWLAAVLATHGLDPFLSSSSASNWSPGEAVKRVLAANVFASSLAIPAILGIVRLVRTRDPFLPLWTPLIYAATPRMGLSSGLGIPTAILAAYGLRELADFVARWLADERNAAWRRRLPNVTKSFAGIPAVVIAGAFFYTVTLATKVQWFYMGREPVEQLDRPSRDFMAWIRTNTPPDSRFVVVTPAQFWFFDRTAEWFPYLAGRRSLTTAQGLEWAGPGAFSAKLGEIDRFKVAGMVDPALFPAFVQRHYCGADYVAIFHERDAPMRRAFAGSTAFRPVHATPHNLLLQPTLTRCPGKGATETSG